MIIRNPGRHSGLPLQARYGIFMIHLQCEHCGKRLRGSGAGASGAGAGKTGRCPKCKNPIAVPVTRTLDAPGGDKHPEDLAGDANLLDLGPKGDVPEEATDRYHEELARRAALEASESAEAPGLPWPLSAILYPLDLNGIIHLLALWLLLFVLPPLIMMNVGLGTEYVPLVFTLPLAYVVYYYTECVRDSSRGSRHAPAFWMHLSDSSKWDCLSQLFSVVGCVAIYFGPVSVCYILRERVDWVYWLLLTGGGFFFPMVLLTVVWFDSFSGLNPIVVVRSIARTFLPYCGIVFLLFGGAWLFVALDFRLYSFWLPPARALAIRVVQLYLVFVAVALLGGFYHRYKARLDWDI